jgi:malonate-semialdehyde dehydrogenase (acetylating)/methylmalonate-semialdehyde dehydrogenase
MYSMRQPLGVVAGITPFNFPAMIPMWKFCPAIACGQRLHPQALRARSVGAADAGRTDERGGLPDGILNVVNGDKEAVDAILDHPEIMAIGFVGSTPIAQYIYARGCANGKRVQCFGGAKNHMIIMPDADMDQAVDALIGAGYGAAGERCMAISVAVPVGEKTADLLIEKLAPASKTLKIGPYTDGNDVDFGPLVTQARDRVMGLVDSGGVEQGAKLVVDGRNFSMQGYENGYFIGGCLFDNVTRDMDIYKEGDLRPGAVGGARQPMRRRCATRWSTNTATAPRSSPATATPRAISQPHQYRHGRRQCADPGAAGLSHLRRLEEIRLRRPQPARPGRLPVLHRTKTVTARWPSGIKEGAEFVIPTMANHTELSSGTGRQNRHGL